MAAHKIEHEEITETCRGPAPALRTQTTIVSLTVYDWHSLLSVLEGSIKIINRDTSRAVRLYEAIAAQLSGVPVTVYQHQGKEEAR